MSWDVFLAVHICYKRQNLLCKLKHGKYKRFYEETILLTVCLEQSLLRSLLSGKVLFLFSAQQREKLCCDLWSHRLSLVLVSLVFLFMNKMLYNLTLKFSGEKPVKLDSSRVTCLMCIYVHFIYVCIYVHVEF